MHRILGTQDRVTLRTLEDLNPMFSTQLCKNKKIKTTPQHTQLSLINGAILVTVAITANSVHSHHSTRLVISNSHFPNNATVHIMTITSYHAISPFKFKHISSNSHMSKFPTKLCSVQSHLQLLFSTMPYHCFNKITNC